MKEGPKKTWALLLFYQSIAKVLATVRTSIKKGTKDMKKFIRGPWGFITVICIIFGIAFVWIGMHSIYNEIQIMKYGAVQREEAKRAEEILVIEEKQIIEPEIIEQKRIIEADILTDFYNYTEEDAIALAKMAYGEARGVPDLKIGDQVISSKCQKAATMWTVLNRYDMGCMDSVYAVVVNPGAYHGYLESNPVTDDLLDLANDVLNRWTREKLGETDVGRVLPADYIYFHGDGTYNYFRNEFEGGTRWTWDYGDPYSE